MDLNYLVTQSNTLIEATHITPLSTNQQKILLTVISMIQPSDPPDKNVYRMSIKQYSGLLGLKGNSIYEEVRKAAINLQSKVVILPNQDGKKGFTTTNWVVRQRYLSDEGVVEFQFSDEIMPYLQQLSTHFTSYKLGNVLSLNSGYSIRMYELMKKWSGLGVVEYNLDDLRNKIGATAKSYLVYGNFKKKIISPAIKEINEKTDVSISFSPIKKGRKTQGIKFFIKRKGTQSLSINKVDDVFIRSDKEELENIYSYLDGKTQNYKLPKDVMKNLISNAQLLWGVSYLDEIVYLIEYVNESDNIKNPIGFINYLIENAKQSYDQGEMVTFKELKYSRDFSKKENRVEIEPEWLKNRDYD